MLAASAEGMVETYLRSMSRSLEIEEVGEVLLEPTANLVRMEPVYRTAETLLQ